MEQISKIINESNNILKDLSELNVSNDIIRKLLTSSRKLRIWYSPLNKRKRDNDTGDGAYRKYEIKMHFGPSNEDITCLYFVDIDFDPKRYVYMLYDSNDLDMYEGPLYGFHITTLSDGKLLITQANISGKFTDEQFIKNNVTTFEAFTTNTAYFL